MYRSSYLYRVILILLLCFGMLYAYLLYYINQSGLGKRSASIIKFAFFIASIAICFYYFRKDVKTEGGVFLKLFMVYFLYMFFIGFDVLANTIFDSLIKRKELVLNKSIYFYLLNCPYIVFWGVTIYLGTNNLTITALLSFCSILLYLYSICEVYKLKKNV